MVEFLLRQGASTNIRDSRGDTPLHAAMYWGHEDIAILLIENGASVTTVNDAGLSAQDSIVYNKERQLKRYRNTESAFRVGSKVEVNYQNLGNWFVGTVTFKGLAGVDVMYLDSERGLDVPYNLLKPHGNANADGNDRRLQQVESVDNMLLFVGAKVQAQYHGEEGTWFPASITRVRMDGTFDVLYDDGDKETKVEKRFIRLCTRCSSAALPSADLMLADEPDINLCLSGGRSRTTDFLWVGMAVKANFKERGTWIDGTITAINEQMNQYQITYDDGEVESDVPLVLIEYLLVGTSVEGKCRGSNTWKPGVLMRARKDGLYDIDYDDGTHEAIVPRECVRLYRGPSR